MARTSLLSLVGVGIGIGFVSGAFLFASHPISGSVDDVRAPLLKQPTDTTIPSWLPNRYQRGEYLVLLFSPGCPACAGSAGQLRQYVSDERLPPLIGLSFGDSSSIERFQADLELSFDVAVVERDTMLQLMGIAGLPQLIYVSSGQPIKAWVRIFPTRHELLAAIVKDPADATER